MLGKSQKFISVLIFVIVFTGCPEMPGRDEYKQIIKIPHSNQDKRMAKFSSYPIEKQIDIYLVAKYGIEGGDSNFFGYMLVDGRNKVPHILKRLDEDSEPRFKTGLIEVLKSIDVDCQCIADNTDILNTLKKNKMQIEEEDSEGIKSFKRLYDGHLQNIISNNKRL